MNPTLSSYLIRSAPDFFRGDPVETTPFSERGGFECGDGWFDPLLALGHLAKEILEDYPEADVYVSQVKEKFSGLRVYLDGTLYGPAYEAIAEAVEVAAAAAASLCEMCGAPGKQVTFRGYLYNACPTHTRTTKVRPHTSHTWTIETLSAEGIGDGDFFKCVTCGCAGGPIEWAPSLECPVHQPFLSGLGASVAISRDCVEAKRQIDVIVTSPQWEAQRLDQARRDAQYVADKIQLTYQIEMDVGLDGTLSGPWPDKAGFAFTLKAKELRSSQGWVLELHDGTTQRFTYFTPMVEWVRSFYQTE